MSADRCRDRAHPRAGGENQCDLRRFGAHGGSYPRGRGKPRPAARRAGRVGLIPARAGKTRGRRRRRAGMWAHPRAGGENPHTFFKPAQRSGSSPRGRGKRGGDGGECRDSRLIPARAGKTGREHLGHPRMAAHPRAGGENASAILSKSLTPGSSPRGRGKPSSLLATPTAYRLIPARAGKTEYSFGIIAVPAAHPRAGGENTRGYITWADITGSSPRGRGKHLRPSGPSYRVRLIPARAGKTSSGASKHPSTWAHPRAGGENRMRVSNRTATDGSSPRGRGKPPGHLVLGQPHRLIPARAGKTPTRWALGQS